MTLTSAPPQLRLAGQLLIEETVRRQQRVSPRGRLQRLLGHSPVRRQDLPWYLGAKGELTVGAILSRLPAGWQVLHSMPIRHACDIDHIVIGPPGVFVLNTKHHPGSRVWAAGAGVVVDDRPLPYVLKAERDALVVMDALACAGVFGTRVTPLIAIVGAASVTRRADTEVPVVAAGKLLAWFAAREERMTGEVVDELGRRLTRPGIWAAPVTEEPGARVRFADLDAEVRKAATVRRLWAIGALSALGGAVFAVLQGVLSVVVTVLAR